MLLKAFEVEKCLPLKIVLLKEILDSNIKEILSMTTRWSNLIAIILISVDDDEDPFIS